jgi:hypothetical protein
MSRHHRGKQTLGPTFHMRKYIIYHRWDRHTCALGQPKITLTVQNQLTNWF